MTAPSSYRMVVTEVKQLIRILGQNPLLTTQELATRLAKSSSWLNDRLGLVKLPENIASLVDEGRINLSNAYVLGKLAIMAPDEVESWVDRSMTMSPAEFVPTCSARVKELKEARRQGRNASPVEWQPTPHVRKLSELKDEMENPSVGPVLVRELGVKTPIDAFELGVKWALHMDPASIEISKQKDADRKRQLEHEKEERRKEREERKQREAASVSANLAKV